MESALVQLLDEPPLMEVELHDKPELVTPPAQVRTPLSAPRFFAARTGCAAQIFGAEPAEPPPETAPPKKKAKQAPRPSRMATGAKRGPKTQTPNLPIEVIKFLLDNELPELKPRPDYFDTFASECRIFKEMDVGPKRRMRRSATLDTYRCSGGIRGARDLPPSQQPVCRRRYGKVVSEPQPGGSTDKTIVRMYNSYTKLQRRLPTPQMLRKDPKLAKDKVVTVEDTSRVIYHVAPIEGDPVPAHLGLPESVVAKLPELERSLLDAACLQTPLVCRDRSRSPRASPLADLRRGRGFMEPMEAPPSPAPAQDVTEVRPAATGIAVRLMPNGDEATMKRWELDLMKPLPPAFVEAALADSNYQPGTRPTLLTHRTRTWIFKEDQNNRPSRRHKSDKW